MYSRFWSIASNDGDIHTASRRSVFSSDGIVLQFLLRDHFIAITSTVHHLKVYASLY